MTWDELDMEERAHVDEQTKKYAREHGLDEDSGEVYQEHMRLFAEAAERQRKVIVGAGVRALREYPQDVMDATRAYVASMTEDEVTASRKIVYGENSFTTEYKRSNPIQEFCKLVDKMIMIGEWDESLQEMYDTPLKATLNYISDRLESESYFHVFRALRRENDLWKIIQQHIIALFPDESEKGIASMIKERMTKVRAEYVSKQRREPNDKLTKALFNPTYQEHKVKGMQIVEGRKGKKKPKQIITKIKWMFTDMLEGKNPRFDSFDREVCLAAISEQETAGVFPYTTTIDRLYRTMIGHDGDPNQKKPSEEMKQNIHRSLSKLMFNEVIIDMSDVCASYGYNDGKPLILHSALLPGDYVEGLVINGQATTAITFHKRSPLFTAAMAKNGQILTYDKRLLAIPNINNSPAVIKCKNYVLRRIQEIKQHNMEPTITFDDVFEKNDMTDADKKIKKRMRDHIEEWFEYWAWKEKIITGYSVLNKKGEEVRKAQWEKVEELHPFTGDEINELQFIRNAKRPNARNLYGIRFSYINKK